MSGEKKPEWRVKRIDYPRGPDVSFEIVAGKELVAQTIMREIGEGWRNDIIASDKAHMTLMAAAPEMLVALRAQEAADEANEVRLNYTEWQKLEDKAKALRVAAIAKAVRQ